MWAPKTPVSTLPGAAARQAATSSSKIRSASAGAAAVLNPGHMPLRVSAARVNWLTSNRPPAVSASERFIRPSASANTR